MVAPPRTLQVCGRRATLNRDDVSRGMTSGERETTVAVYAIYYLCKKNYTKNHFSVAYKYKNFLFPILSRLNLKQRVKLLYSVHHFDISDVKSLGPVIFLKTLNIKSKYNECR